jgi:transglutaminase-like putative cysteine protease
MALRHIAGALLVGVLLGNSISNHLSSRRVEEERNNNLSQKIVRAVNVEGISQNCEKISLPEKIERDEAFITILADRIAGYDYKILVSTRDYFKYKQMNKKTRHWANEDSIRYVNWVTYDDEVIRRTAKRLTKHLDSPKEKAQALLDFVHQHVYMDKDDANYVRYPLETMVERCGNCEDFSVLGAALMKSIGIDVALISFRDHLALGINGNFSGRYYCVDGKKYYYAETTGTEWLRTRSNKKIGYMPSRYYPQDAQICIVK